MLKTTSDFFAIRGVSADGSECWFTGKAGDAFVSPNRADAFLGFNLEGARRKAAALNNATVLHGIHFMVPVSDIAEAA